VSLFFASAPLSGALAAAAVFFLEVFIDNTFARAKWPLVLASSWAVALILGMGNILFLVMIKG
ncbi:MAG: NADH-quinone oxidoreductase subunit H, partial [Candidatus Omnitrophota bacterium]